MKLSIYRQRTPHSELEHGACIRGATTEEDIDLIDLALSTEKPTLIGFQNQPTIIKTAKPGDESLSFEGLYDTCLTVSDLTKMKKAGVDKPEDLPKGKYVMSLTFRMVADVDLRLAITAENHGACRQRLLTLIDGDAEFREALFEALFQAWRREHDAMVYTIRDTQLVDPAEFPKDWEFV